LDEIRLYVEAIDNGDAGFKLHIANFSDTDLELRHVELDHWYLANRALTPPKGLLQAKGSAKAGRPGTGTFSVTLTSADIRTLIQGIEPAQNVRSAPAARLEAVREARVPFSILRGGTAVTLPTYVIDQLTGTKQE
jgi:hypothetical protein